MSDTAARPATSVLIADDSAVVRSALRTLISRIVAPKSTIEEANDGTAAISMARALRPDIIVLDYAMGRGITGVEAATVIKKTLPKTAIFIFSLYASEIGPAVANAAGIDAVIEKPDGIVNLLDRVREHFQQRPN